MLLKYNDVVYHDDDHDQMLELADDVLNDKHYVFWEVL